MSEKSILYFQPGQLMFHAHGNLNNSSEAIQKLIAWANDIASPQGINVSVSDNVMNDGVFDFNPVQMPVLYLKSASIKKGSGLKPAVDESGHEKLSPEQGASYVSPPVRVPPPFSLVFANVTSERWPQLPIEPDQEQQLAEASKELLDLILELDEKRGDAPIHLEVITPNWLMSGGPEPGGTGGPGGRPSPARKDDIGKHRIKLTPYKVPALPQNVADVSQSTGGSDVVVAILDTSYPADQKENIYSTWVREIAPDKTPHPLIKSLLGTSGCLTIHPDATVDRYLPGTMIHGHDYDMTDHGLFVAGIINSIAPQAELHLYQVLNKYGLGDLRSIARALEQVTHDFQGRNLVVNLSLTMNLPLDKKHLQPNDPYRLGQKILSQKPWWLAQLVASLFNWIVRKPMLCTCDSWFDRQSRPFEWICDLVYTLESRVIAAAGNNAQQGKGRPLALYPAAFDRVFGVGALSKNIPPDGRRVRNANYSNLADRPPRKGITTLGGEEGVGNGILGVYIGPFPNDAAGKQQKNEYGWAWWAGTSFATPIISGVTAVALSNLVRSNPARRSRTEDAITELYDAEMRRTDHDEDVLGVEQF